MRLPLLLLVAVLWNYSSNVVEGLSVSQIAKMDVNALQLASFKAVQEGYNLGLLLYKQRLDALPDQGAEIRAKIRRSLQLYIRTVKRINSIFKAKKQTELLGKELKLALPILLGGNKSLKIMEKAILKTKGLNGTPKPAFLPGAGANHQIVMAAGTPGVRSVEQLFETLRTRYTKDRLRRKFPTITGIKAKKEQKRVSWSSTKSPQKPQSKVTTYWFGKPKLYAFNKPAAVELQEVKSLFGPKIGLHLQAAHKFCAKKKQFRDRCIHSHIGVARARTFAQAKFEKEKPSTGSAPIIRTLARSSNARSDQVGSKAVAKEFLNQINSVEKAKTITWTQYNTIIWSKRIWNIRWFVLKALRKFHWKNMNSGERKAYVNELQKFRTLYGEYLSGKEKEVWVKTMMSTGAKVVTEPQSVAY